MEYSAGVQSWSVDSIVQYWGMCTVLGYGVQCWSTELECGLYSTVMGYVVQCWGMEYSAGVQSWSVDSIVQYWGMYYVVHYTGIHSMLDSGNI